MAQAVEQRFQAVHTPESITTTTPNKIILVGLGEVAITHQEALKRLGQTVLAGVDIDPSKEIFGGKDVPVYQSIQEAAQEQPEPDIIVVAVPTPDHYAVCQEVFSAFDQKPVRVFVEKPCADKLEEAHDLLTNTPENIDLESLLHFAYNPEVLWAAKHLPDWLKKHGPIREYRAVFADARSAPDQAQKREVLGSSWKDLGINALSAAQRLIGLIGLELHPLPEPADYEATIAFNSRSTEGRGTIATQWSAESRSCDSVFTFASDAQLKLNHYLVSGSFENRDGVVMMTSYNRGIQRRLSHYLNLYKDLLGTKEMALTNGQSLKLHKLLLTDEAACRQPP
jgi:predicted dehydrogenase